MLRVLYVQLLDYLQPSCSPYHVEAVQLVWAVDALSESRYLESMISQRLSSSNRDMQVVTFEAFGNLWRYTGLFSLSNQGRMPVLTVC